MKVKSITYPVEGIESIVAIDFDAMPLLFDAEPVDFDYIVED